jgi:hypothetical protein
MAESDSSDSTSTTPGEYGQVIPSSRTPSLPVLNWPESPGDWTGDLASDECDDMPTALRKRCNTMPGNFVVPDSADSDSHNDCDMTLVAAIALQRSRTEPQSLAAIACHSRSSEQRMDTYCTPPNRSSTHTSSESVSEAANYNVNMSAVNKQRCNCMAGASSDTRNDSTLCKLHFVLSLVKCVLELAESRRIQSESQMSATYTVDDNKQSELHQLSAFTVDHACFLSDGRCHLEQLLLYIRALQLLSSAIQLAQVEMKAGKLTTSMMMKNTLKELNHYYKQCLSVCKQLHQKDVMLESIDTAQTGAITADKLLYAHAIEMCQTAALDELFGNPQECIRRYRRALVLLHSLTQQAADNDDVSLLNQYRESVEKRLLHLCTLEESQLERTIRS